MDELIRKKIEAKYLINKSWMSQEAFTTFIDYKFDRENKSDVLFDTALLHERFPNLNSCKILDAGCGAGDLVINLAKKGIDIKGLDMGHEDIEIASLKAKKYNLNPNIFKKQDCSQIPFNSESFDIVLCIEVLEHTGKYYMDVIREIHRILKPGGFAYITIPNKLCPYDTHLNTWIPHWIPKSIRVPYLNRIRGEKALEENYLLEYNFFTPKQIKTILNRIFNNCDLNRFYISFRLKSLSVDSNSSLKKIPKKLIKKIIQFDTINEFVIGFLCRLYFFQSIKIIAQK